MYFRFSLVPSLLEEILCYIHTVARCVEENCNNPTAKFWRALLNKAYEVLDKVRISLTRAHLMSLFSPLKPDH